VRRRLVLVLAALVALVAAPLASAAAPAPVTAVPPARVDATLADAVAAKAPTDSIDVIVDLDGIAGPGLRSRLASVATYVHAFDHLPLAGLKLPVGRLADLRRVAGVRAVYPNKQLRWELADSAKLMNTAGAWAKGYDGKGVNVAVLDSGVDFTHPDLAPAEVDNVKLALLGPPQPTQTVKLPKGANSDTTSGHGTHVAGDVAGRGIKSNGKYRGMGFGAGLIGLGAGDVIEIFTALDGFDYVLAHQKDDAIRVVTNSWGTDFAPFDPDDPVNVATKKVTDAGIVVLFAAGNSYDEMTISPYAAPWVITVAAGTKTGAVTDFSSGGIEVDTSRGFGGADVPGDPRRIGDLGLYHPSVTSTGENVVSTRSLSTVVPLTGAPEDSGLPPEEVPYYTTLSGTSMATPETAGVVAQILQADPALTPAEVKTILETTARPIPGAPFFKQGYGYTDSSAAVDRALELRDGGASAAASLAAAHDARDATILSEVRHPSHATASTDPIGTGPTSFERKFTVAPGTAGVKAAMVGPATIELNAVDWEITITDAKGQPVASTSNLPLGNISSGAAWLDVDLAKAETPPDKLAFGEWTFAFSSSNSPAVAVPVDNALLTDLVSPAQIFDVIAAFDAPATNCAPVDVFEARGTQVLRFQDDDPSGAPFPANPKYTYIGPVRDGSLGDRAPKYVAADFDVASTLIPGPTPRFTTAALTEPVTLGEGAAVTVFVQGKTGTVRGLFGTTVVDVAPDGTATTIATLDEDLPVNEAPSAPAKTTALVPIGHPYTVAAGHRIGVLVSVTSITTVGNTLFYDSDEFPSGVTLTTGAVVQKSLCGVAAASAGGSTGAPAAAPASSRRRGGQLPATGGTPAAPAAALALVTALALVELRRRSSRPA
jgi:serine protease AprX